MPGLTEPNQVGKREELADLISIVDARNTPFTSRLNKDKQLTGNTLFEWQVDKYADPKTTGTVDGKDVEAFENAVENRARLKNYVQVFRRTALVSRLAESANVAGVKSEIANSATKKTKELARDIEATFLAGNQAQADDGVNPYLTCAMDNWLSVAGPTGVAAVPAAYRLASAQVETTATASLTEDTHIQGMLQAIFDATGMDGEYVLYAGSILRRRFTDMTRTVANTTSTSTKVRMFNQSADSKKVTNSTTIYEGDYGTIEIVSSSFIGGSTPDTDRGYLVDHSKLRMRYMKMPTVERLADNGGGPRVLIEQVCGLQVDNPKGMGKFKP